MGLFKKRRKVLETKEVTLKPYSAYTILKLDNLDNHNWVITCNREGVKININEDEVLASVHLEDSRLISRVVTFKEEDTTYLNSLEVGIVGRNNVTFLKCFKDLSNIVSQNFVSTYSTVVQNEMEKISNNYICEVFSKIRVKEDTEVCVLGVYESEGILKTKKLEQEKVTEPTEIDLPPSIVVALKTDDFVTVIASTFKGIYTHHFYENIIEDDSNEIIHRLKRCGILKMKKTII